MLPGTWPNPPHADEYAVRFDSGRSKRLLIVPALFDEGNKLRHFSVEMMRALDRAGIDSSLPDLPGTNESLAALQEQTLETWRNAVTSAASSFDATLILAIRGGALCVPHGQPTFAYAPVDGANLLRGMLRARVLADREAGQESDRDALLQRGMSEGLQLAGYQLGAEMLSQLQDAKATAGTIQQSELGGPGLWLRAEPDHDPEQAERLASRVMELMT